MCQINAFIHAFGATLCSHIHYEVVGDAIRVLFISGHNVTNKPDQKIYHSILKLKLVPIFSSTWQRAELRLYVKLSVYQVEFYLMVLCRLLTHICVTRPQWVKKNTHLPLVLEWNNVTTPILSLINCIIYAKQCCVSNPFAHHHDTWLQSTYKSQSVSNQTWRFCCFYFHPVAPGAVIPSVELKKQRRGVIFIHVRCTYHVSNWRNGANTILLTCVKLWMHLKLIKADWCTYASVN